MPGGRSNTAAGDYSFAAGRRAKIDAAYDGAFVWADSYDGAFSATAANQFRVRAQGGVGFYTNSGLTAGVTMGAGASAWSSVSKRDAKENFQEVDARAVLDKVAAMPIQTWNYKAQDPDKRHIGPMAEDFRAAFNVGDFPDRITTIDADGVALAAIQGLNQKVEDRKAAIASLEEQLGATRTENASLSQGLTSVTAQLATVLKQNTALEARLAALEQRTGNAATAK